MQTCGILDQWMEAREHKKDYGNRPNTWTEYADWFQLRCEQDEQLIELAVMEGVPERKFIAACSNRRSWSRWAQGKDSLRLPLHTIEIKGQEHRMRDMDIIRLLVDIKTEINDAHSKLEPWLPGWQFDYAESISSEVDSEQSAFNEVEGDERRGSAMGSNEIHSDGQNGNRLGYAGAGPEYPWKEGKRQAIEDEAHQEQVNDVRDQAKQDYKERSTKGRASRVLGLFKGRLARR